MLPTFKAGVSFLLSPLLKHSQIYPSVHMVNLGTSISSEVVDQDELSQTRSQLQTLNFEGLLHYLTSKPGGQ